MKPKYVYILWERFKYRKEVTRMLGAYATKRVAQKALRKSAKASLKDGITYNKEHDKISGHYDDVDYSFWLQKSPLLGEA
jgi:hypothetical protein